MLKASTSTAGTEDGLRKYVRSIFDQYDADNSNSIEAEEFHKLCAELGYHFDDEEVRYRTTNQSFA